MAFMKLLKDSIFWLTLIKLLFFTNFKICATLDCIYSKINKKSNFTKVNQKYLLITYNQHEISIILFNKNLTENQPKFCLKRANGTYFKLNNLRWLVLGKILSKKVKILLLSICKIIEFSCYYY